MKKRMRVKEADEEFIEYTSKQDSVTLTRTATGTYSWTIKIYEDLQGGSGSHDKLLKKIRFVDNDLKKKFNNFIVKKKESK